jgi:hypothetical protein
MGFNLWDIGAVATGAIERDREVTKENLLIRADELKAKRDSLIKRKDKKYDMEIKSYYKEKNKLDKINSLNAEAASFNEANKASGKTYDQDLYATRYLLATVDGFADLEETERKKMIKNFGSSGNNYVIQTKDPDKLAALQSKEEDIILKNYSNELKNAKDDSFLINKILGKSTNQTPTKDLEEAINADVKASEIVTKIDDAENKNKTDGSSITLSKKTYYETPPKEFQTEWSSKRDAITFDISKNNNNTFKFLSLTAGLGGGDELSYKYNKTDSKIEGMNGPAIENLLAMETMFTDIKNSKDTMLKHYNEVDSNKGNIGKHFNADNVYKEMSSLLKDRGSNINRGAGNPLKNLRLTTFVPISIANQDNILMMGEVAVDLSDAKQMKSVANHMSDFIKAEALLANKDIDDVELQDIGARIYKNLYHGDANTVVKFKNYLYNNDENIKKAFDDGPKKKDETAKTTEGETTNVETTSDGKVAAPETKFTLGLNKDKINSIVVPADGAIPGMKKGDKIPLNKDNIEKLKALNNEEINSLISEGIKFGVDTKTMAPNINVTQPGTTQAEMEAKTKQMNEEMKSWFSDEANKKRLEKQKKNFKRKR